MPRWRKGKRGYCRFYDKKTGERLYPGDIILNDNGTYKWIRVSEYTDSFFDKKDIGYRMRA